MSAPRQLPSSIAQLLASLIGIGAAGITPILIKIDPDSELSEEGQIEAGIAAAQAEHERDCPDCQARLAKEASANVAQRPDASQAVAGTEGASNAAQGYTSSGATNSAQSSGKPELSQAMLNSFGNNFTVDGCNVNDVVQFALEVGYQRAQADAERRKDKRTPIGFMAFVGSSPIGPSFDTSRAKVQKELDKRMDNPTSKALADGLGIDAPTVKPVFN